MRTLVDIRESQIEALDELAKAEGKSRASLIRQAIEDYLARRHARRREDAFGLWGTHKVDGLAYQRKVREEW